MEHNLTYNGKNVGLIDVQIQGLFYKIRGRFSGVRELNPHIMVTCDDKETDLGVCVPCGKDWEINRCLPIKNVGIGDLRFFVGTEAEDGLFIPICSNMPFAEIDKLTNGKFVNHLGKQGILLESNYIN